MHISVQEWKCVFGRGADWKAGGKWAHTDIEVADMEKTENIRGKLSEDCSSTSYQS